MVSFLRLTNTGTFLKKLVFSQILNTLISNIVILSITFLTVMYYLFDNYSSFSAITTGIPGEPLFFANTRQAYLLNQVLVTLHPVSVYYFPFIYIFVLITILSVLYCLSYNINEFSTFVFYCLIILLAGYTMFFTSSLLLFFFSYEMLLIPSFYILYNFAKTRKCVEAAYLMFF